MRVHCFRCSVLETIARSIRDELPDGLIPVGEVTICVREKLSIMSLIREYK